MLEPGDRLDRWLVEDRFAGGWGVVYVLHDPEDPVHERVAAKTMRPEIAADSARAEQFDRECFAWLSLGSHKHIVRLFSVDRFRGQAFALGEYVPPGVLPNTLQAWLDAALIDLESALRFGMHMCWALEHARSRGLLVHQDLKPENVMITPTGVAKVADWGLSRLELPAAEGVAAVGAVPYSYAGESESDSLSVHGTRGYAAPECSAADAEPGPAADMFSLGVCLVEMLGGVRPEPDAAATAIAGTLAPLEGHAAEALAEELARCVSSRSGERPASTSTLQSAMAHSFRELSGVPIVGPPPPVEETLADIGQRAYALFMLGKPDEALAVQARLQARLSETRGDEAPIVLMDYKEAGGFTPVVPEEQVTAAENELREYPDDLQRLRNAQAVNYLAGRVDRALELCRRWLAQRPDDVEQLTTASNLARRLGDAKATRGFLDRAVRAEPNNAKAWLQRARLLEDLDLTEALESARRAADIDPENVDALIVHGHLLRVHGDPDAAAAQFEAATRADPSSALAWFDLGTFENERGRQTEAFECFSRAADLGLPQALNSLGGLVGSAGAADEAIAYFERAIAADPSYARPWCNLGLVCEQLQQYEKARDAYARAVAIDKDYALAQVGLERMAARRGW